MGSHLRLLLPFVLCFLLPTVLVQLAELLGLAWWSTGQDPFIPPGPHPHHHPHHHHHAHFHHKVWSFWNLDWKEWLELGF